jgi:hypothetical protein
MGSFKFNIGQMVEVDSDNSLEVGRVGRVKSRGLIGKIPVYVVIDDKGRFVVRESNLRRYVEPFRKNP